MVDKVREELLALIQKAKELYANDYSDHTENEYIADMILDTGMVNEWIPVTERLPENIANKVLVAYDGGSFCVGYGHYEGRNGWINLENDLLFSDFGLIVTHWMPLPEAPKDGE